MPTTAVATAAPLTDTRPAGGAPAGDLHPLLRRDVERFSYYGVRAFLILYRTAPVAAGGLGLLDKGAASIYGTYTGRAWAAAISPASWRTAGWASTAASSPAAGDEDLSDLVRYLERLR